MRKPDFNVSEVICVEDLPPRDQRLARNYFAKGERVWCGVVEVLPERGSAVPESVPRQIRAECRFDTSPYEALAIVLLSVTAGLAILAFAGEAPIALPVMAGSLAVAALAARLVLRYRQRVARRDQMAALDTSVISISNEAAAFARHADSVTDTYLEDRTDSPARRAAEIRLRFLRLEFAKDVATPIDWDRAREDLRAALRRVKADEESREAERAAKKAARDAEREAERIAHQKQAMDPSVTKQLDRAHAEAEALGTVTEGL